LISNDLDIKFRKYQHISNESDSLILIKQKLYFERGFINKEKWKFNSAATSFANCLDHGHIFNREFRIQCLNEIEDIFKKENEERALKRHSGVETKDLNVDWNY